MSLQTGSRAPEIRSGDFQLSKLRGQTVVIYFFPKADTPGCTKESCEFRDASKKFAKLNAEIVGVSPDKEAAQQRFAAKYGLPFTLVPDPDHSIAETYGVWKQKSFLRPAVSSESPGDPAGPARRIEGGPVRNRGSNSGMGPSQRRQPR